MLNTKHIVRHIIWIFILFYFILTTIIVFTMLDHYKILNA